MGLPIKVYILGSCVSRDPFEMADKNDFEVVGYYARSSFASLGATPFVDEKILSDIESNWQRKMVHADMSKAIFSSLQDSNADIFLIDLVDERFSVSINGKSIHTVSSEYKKALYRPNEYKLIKPFDSQRRSLWLKGLEKLSQYLIDSGLGHKVVINQVYWTLDCDDKSSMQHSLYSEEYVNNSNIELDFMYSEISKYLPNARFIRYTENMLNIDKSHKWGFEPFHFSKNVQFEQLRQLKKIFLDMELDQYGLDYIKDYQGRRMYYRYKPAKDENHKPLLVILHGHTYNSKPSMYENGKVNILVPIDNYGVNNCGSWWLGENGDFFVKDLLQKLIRLKLNKTNGSLFMWGSSMGGYGALHHGISLGAKAVYANIPQIRLLGSTYSDKGMKKFFEPIFGQCIREDYNDIGLYIDETKKNNGDNNFPMFFIAQSRFDYEKYLEEQSLYFFNKCLENELNISYEVFPKKGHSLMMPVNVSVDKMLGYFEDEAATVKLEKNRIDTVIYGLMNFSVLYASTKAYKSARKEYEEYKQCILDLGRLKIREKILFDYTLPIFLEKHNELIKKNILLKLNIAISDQLPVNLLSRFDSLVEENKEAFNIIKVCETKPHDWQEILEGELALINKNYVFDDEILFCNFRLDDDDVLSPAFYDNIPSYVSDIYEGFYLTFPKGFVGTYGDSYDSFYSINKPYLAIGLSKICRYSFTKSRIITDSPIVSSVAHTLIVNHSKTLLDSTFPAYIWTMHNYSDTRSNDVNEKQSAKKIKSFIEDNNLSLALKNEVGEFFGFIES
ncbi:hypothetical protein DN062_02595 [Nitrincola tibetensis]|uniref:Uncharacterized protein n=1 Tax=Nitrincola tibetensis TaxID=2219697 RepID=A0A364NQK4_9GAMM|nr:DUF6270 domain-containing protein [Nitrincola tibetensis]RAU19175.1 hypothetical protein DN062_02595 [Nitrincola tibetensis]